MFPLESSASWTGTSRPVFAPPMVVEGATLPLPPAGYETTSSLSLVVKIATGSPPCDGVGVAVGVAVIVGVAVAVGVAVGVGDAALPNAIPISFTTCGLLSASSVMESLPASLVPLDLEALVGLNVTDTVQFAGFAASGETQVLPLTA